MSDAVAAKPRTADSGRLLFRVSPPDKKRWSIKDGGMPCAWSITSRTPLTSSAAAFGFAGAVLRGNCADPFPPRRHSMGTLAKVDIICR